MSPCEILAVFDDERRMLGPAGYRLEQTERLTRSIPLDGGWGWIAWSAHDAAGLDDAIATEIVHFTSLGCRFEWKVYDHDRPADLRQRLGAHGFHVGPMEAFLVLPTRDLMEPTVVASDSIDVRRMNSVEEFEDYLTLERIVWPERDATLHVDSRRRFREYREEVSYYVAYAEGQPVSSARVDFRKGIRFAGLYGGATLEAFRGRGFYTALVAARGNEARERGAEFLTVDALPTSRPILERRGFQCLSRTYPCTWTVTATAPSPM